MPRLWVDLAAGLIDVEADIVHFVAADVMVINSVGTIGVENRGGTPRSVHRFSMSNPALLGIREDYSAYVEQGAMFLATACSLANHRVLFGPVNPVYLGAHFEHDPIPPVVEQVGGRPGVTRTSIAIPQSVAVAEQVEVSVQLDEKEVLCIGAQLSALDIFSPSPDDALRVNNTREAARSYFEAIRAPSLLLSYVSLYQCLEKSVNADGRDRKGADFDKHVAGIVGTNQGDIEELRVFRNRLEHTLRNQHDWTTFHESSARLGVLAQQLKLAADTTLCANLSL